MRHSVMLIFILLTGRLFAFTLEDFEPYSMYGNPREKVEDYFDFAVNHNIPLYFEYGDVMGPTVPVGEGKLFSIYKEEVGEHIYYLVFYAIGYFHEDYPSSSYTKEKFDLIDYEYNYTKLQNVTSPSIYQALYFEKEDSNLVLLDRLEYLNDRQRYISVGTLQPWDNGMEFGYWDVYYYEIFVDDQGYHEGEKSHFAIRRSIDKEGKATDKIWIDASTPLIDPNNPLKYTIQNAFDQNPATSYVEDTEDDLMSIDITIRDYPITISTLKRKIINGYAANENLYKLNSRIKTITLQDGSEFTLNDNTLGPQETPIQTGGDLIVTSVYQGETYQDSCVAEFDLIINSDYYLFGGRHE